MLIHGKSPFAGSFMLLSQSLVQFPPRRTRLHLPPIPTSLAEMGAGLILDPEGGALLGPCLAPVVEARGGNIGVSEPLLNLGDIRFMRERISGGGGAQRMHAKAVYFGADTGLQAVFQ